MTKGEFHILPTDITPEVRMDVRGVIKIKGRGLVVNRTSLPAQIEKWIDEYLDNPADTTYILIAFEYLNSFSTSILSTIIKKISRVIHQGKKLIIQWYYEEDDDDIIERGEYISANLGLAINFIPTSDIATCF